MEEEWKWNKKGMERGWNGRRMDGEANGWGKGTIVEGSVRGKGRDDRKEKICVEGGKGKGKGGIGRGGEGEGRDGGIECRKRINR